LGKRKSLENERDWESESSLANESLTLAICNLYAGAMPGIETLVPRATQ